MASQSCTIRRRPGRPRHHPRTNSGGHQRTRKHARMHRRTHTHIRSLPDTRINSHAHGNEYPAFSTRFGVCWRTRKMCTREYHSWLASACCLWSTATSTTLRARLLRRKSGRKSRTYSRPSTLKSLRALKRRRHRLPRPGRSRTPCHEASRLSTGTRKAFLFVGCVSLAQCLHCAPSLLARSAAARSHRAQTHRLTFFQQELLRHASVHASAGAPRTCRGRGGCLIWRERHASIHTHTQRERQLKTLFFGLSGPENDDFRLREKRFIQLTAAAGSSSASART